MGRLYWFCPENDLALAAGLSRYTPPRVALEMRRAGALLPTLWASESDRVLVMERGDRVDSAEDLAVEPWGWSPYVRTALLKAGVNESLLPSDRRVERIRQLSHRRSASRVLELCGYPTDLIPVEAADIDSAMAEIARRGGDAVVKLPWSCSGRGVVETRSMSPEALRKMLAGMIGRQGSVMIEPRYERTADFAALFRIDNGTVSHEGYSSFTTDAGGHYRGNLIAPQSQIRASLPRAVDEWIELLIPALAEVYGTDYEGWLGVDMLSYRDAAGEEKVMPCVEVNLRMTMGVAALLVARSGRLPWPRAELLTLLPGETPEPDSISLAAEPAGSLRLIVRPLR